MDPFRRFPPEIMQQFIIHTADFVAVENLSSASPWANAVFHAQPRAITADLIASNPITATPETQRLIRDTVILYTPSIHCRSLGEFQQTWKNKNGLLSDLLPQQITATETLRLIPVAAKIQRIACITRDHIASLRPARTLAWTESRLHWALWHLLRYSVLRKTAQRRWGWTAELVMEIGDMKVTHIHWPFVATRDQWQIWSIAGFLADLVYGDHAENEKQGSCQNEPARAPWDSPAWTLMPLVDSLGLELTLLYD
jgi:hypothetical protein